MSEAGEFSLIVTEVDPPKLAEASRRFAAAFSLDESIAQQICKSAPIIFAQKLTKAEVKAISPNLTELSKAGIEFRVTARVAGRIPKVNWPVRPRFTAAGSASANGLAFEWDNTTFVCPGCGETFLFRRLGKLPLAEAPADDRPAGTEGGASAHLEFADEAAQPHVEGVEGMEPLAGEGEPLEIPETAEVGDPAPVEPATAPLEPAVEKPAANAAPEEELVEVAPEPAAEEAPETGELYNVFLSKITDTSKHDKASELIAKIKGCPKAEAKEMTSRLVIPLAKNVSREKAEDILNQFKKLKIFGRITKVK